MEKRRKILMKIMVVITVCMVCLSWTDYVKADDSLDVLKKQEEALMDEEEINNELQKLYDYISKIKTDDELLNELNAKEYIENYIETGEGNLSFSKISESIISLIFREVTTILSLAISIIVLGIVCALIKNLQDAFSTESISQIAFFACYALIIVLLSKSFLISISIAKDIITDITNFMSALLPILVMMLGTAGGFTQAATMDPIVLGATITIPQIYLNIIIPLILIMFVLQFANNISLEQKLNNLCKLLKQVVLWIQGFAITIFIGILTIRGITSSTIDAVTMKTAKFAVDSFIPIVGKSFSDAIASVAGYSLIIKNAISSVGLIVIILIILYPVVKMLLMSFIYKLSASVLEPIADKRITSSIASAGEAIVLLMSCVLCVSLMFFVLLGIMAAAGKFVVGG